MPSALCANAINAGRSGEEHRLGSRQLSPGRGQEEDTIYLGMVEIWMSSDVPADTR